MAVPNARTWFPGDLATPTLLNSEIKTVVNFEKTRPIWWSTLNADQSITNDTWTDVAWNGDLKDSDDVHSGSSANFVIVTSGLYDIRTQCMWAANVTGRRGVRVWSNTDSTSVVHSGIRSSTGTPDGSAYTGYTQDTSQEVSILTSLTAGHSLKIQVWQNSGGSLALMGDLGASNVESYVCLRWMAAS